MDSRKFPNDQVEKWLEACLKKNSELKEQNKIPADQFCLRDLVLDAIPKEDRDLFKSWRKDLIQREPLAMEQMENFLKSSRPLLYPIVLVDIDDKVKHTIRDFTPGTKPALTTKSQEENSLKTSQDPSLTIQVIRTRQNRTIAQMLWDKIKNKINRAKVPETPEERIAQYFTQQMNKYHKQCKVEFEKTYSAKIKEQSTEEDAKKAAKDAVREFLKAQLNKSLGQMKGGMIENLAEITGLKGAEESRGRINHHARLNQLMPLATSIRDEVVERFVAILSDQNKTMSAKPVAYKKM